MTCYQNCSNILAITDSICNSDLCFCSEGWSGKGLLLEYNGCHVSEALDSFLDIINATLAITLFIFSLLKGKKVILPLIISKEIRTHTVMKHNSSDMLYLGKFPQISTLVLFYLIFSGCAFGIQLHDLFGYHWKEAYVVLNMLYAALFSSMCSNMMVQADIFFNIIPVFRRMGFKFKPLVISGIISSWVVFPLCVFGPHFYVNYISESSNQDPDAAYREAAEVQIRCTLVGAMVISFLIYISLNLNILKVLAEIRCSLKNIVFAKGTLPTRQAPAGCDIRTLRKSNKYLNFFLVLMSVAYLPYVALLSAIAFTDMLPYYYLEHNIQIMICLSWCLFSLFFHRNIHVKGVDVGVAARTRAAPARNINREDRGMKS